jgi:hypothetical protein
MCLWHFWPKISSGIKSWSTDLNSWDTMHTLVIILHLFPATPNPKISIPLPLPPQKKTTGKNTLCLLLQQGNMDIMIT